MRRHQRVLWPTLSSLSLSHTFCTSLSHSPFSTLSLISLFKLFFVSLLSQLDMCAGFYRLTHQQNLMCLIQCNKNASQCPFWEGRKGCGLHFVLVRQGGKEEYKQEKKKDKREGKEKKYWRRGRVETTSIPNEFLSPSDEWIKRNKSYDPTRTCCTLFSSFLIFSSLLSLFHVSFQPQ